MQQARSHILDIQTEMRQFRDAWQTYLTDISRGGSLAISYPILIGNFYQRYTGRIYQTNDTYAAQLFADLKDAIDFTVLTEELQVTSALNFSDNLLIFLGDLQTALAVYEDDLNGGGQEDNQGNGGGKGGGRGR